MAEQERSSPRFPVAALLMVMALITSCATTASASKSPSFSGEWAYAKKCDLGHYLSLHLQQRGDRVTGDWSEGTNVRGMMGSCRERCAETRCISATVAMTEEIATPHARRSPRERKFKLENGQLIRYEKYGSSYRRTVALYPDIAGKDVPYDKDCSDPEDAQ